MAQCTFQNICFCLEVAMKVVKIGGGGGRAPPAPRPGINCTPCKHMSDTQWGSVLFMSCSCFSAVGLNSLVEM
jgi:hypothetical protein